VSSKGEKGLWSLFRTRASFYTQECFTIDKYNTYKELVVLKQRGGHKSWLLITGKHMVVPSKEIKENVSIKRKVTSEHEVGHGACFRCHSAGHSYTIQKAVTAKDKNKHRQEGCYFECSRQGHIAGNCPYKKKQNKPFKPKDNPLQVLSLHIDALVNRPY